MKKETGLWIDHEVALVVQLANPRQDNAVMRIESDVAGKVRFGGRAAEEGDEDTRDRRRENYLQAYYDRVIDAIRDDEAILIFGPGEAKLGLKKRLEGCNLGGKIAAVEAADKMTENQVAAKVRDHFRASRQKK